MLSLPCPNDDAEQTYRRMAVHTRDLALRNSLLAEGARVGVRAAEYLHLANQEKLYLFETEAPIGVSAEELTKVYDRVLVRGAGRPTYDRLKASARLNRCPLCGQRDVKTIDHYLPKSSYPELAVFPANLIPSCSDCNFIKRGYVPATHAAQTFHPYFDDWSVHRILRATVEVGEHVEVVFSIEAVTGFAQASLRRAEQHFDLLGLGALYAGHAAVELVQSKDIYRRNFGAGVDVLRSELQHTSLSRERGNINAWAAALYRGLADSDEFCQGGFEFIED
ncbi:MAG: HNH endonuclease signature motif containing protein [Sterolibacterium sp.]|jgi:hypothetical protein